MKRLILLLTICLSVFAVTEAKSATFDIAGRHGLGLGFGYISPKEGTVDSGIFPVINYTYGINSKYSLELSLGRASLDVVDEDDSSFQLGKEISIPLQLTVQYRMPMGNLSPYLGAGVGYYINKFDIGGDLKDLEDALKGIDPAGDIDVELDNSFGYHINVGTDYFLSKNLAITLDARYLWSKANMNLTVTTSGGSLKMKEKVDLDSFVIAAGVKYFF